MCVIVLSLYMQSVALPLAITPTTFPCIVLPTKELFLALDKISSWGEEAFSFRSEERKVGSGAFGYGRAANAEALACSGE